MDERATRGTQERIFGFADGRTQVRAWTAEVEARLRAEAAPLVAGGRCALLALGSLARRELCFGSDLDLTLLTDGGAVDSAAFAAFQHGLLDRGVRLQVTLRTPELSLAAADADVRAALNLWEGRAIAGEAALAEALTAEVARRLGARSALSQDGAGAARGDPGPSAQPVEYTTDRLPGCLPGGGPPDPQTEPDSARRYGLLGGRADVVEALLKGTRARRERFGGTVYCTEPNLKQGKGGLRDAQTIGWLRRLQGAVALEPRLVHRLEYALAALFRLRNALFLETGDRIGALVLPAQRRVALRLGFGAGGEARPETRLLRHQFEIARTISEVLEVVFEQIEEAGGPSYGERRRFLAPDAAPVDDPFAWIRLACRGGGRIPYRVRARLAERVNDLPGSLVVAQALPLLLEPATGGDELGLFEKLDVLPRLAPEWSRIAFLPRGDAQHLYTVDRHTFMAVRLAKRALSGELLHPAAQRVELVSPFREALILAALFHDIGKGDEGPDPHEVVGERLAREILGRWGVPPRVIEVAASLVLRHLELSRAAQTVDLRDATEVSRLAHALGSLGELDALYLLTLVDAAAVKQEPPSRWFVDLVTGTFLTLRRLLERSDPDGLAELAAEARAEVLALLPGSSGRQALLAELPDAFFARGRPGDLVARLEVAAAALATGAAEVRVTSAGGEPWPLLVIDVAAADRPGLLSRITWALALHNLNLLEASITSTLGGLAVDHLLVEDRYRRLVGNPAALDALRAQIATAIHDGPSRPLPPARGGRRRFAPLEVRVLPGESGHDTVIEIAGEDRPGVAHRLADLLYRHGLSITGGRIATLEGHVRDVFHVERAGGGAVTDADERERLAAEIRGMFG